LNNFQNISTWEMTSDVKQWKSRCR